MLKKQLNIDLPKPEARRVREDAVEMKVTLNEYVRQAIDRFRSMPLNQRRIYLSSPKQRKMTGRPIKQK